MQEKDDAHFMRLALDEAGLAFDEGEVPVGAVLVDESGSVVASARNARERTNDPSAHAEMLALRKGAALLGRWRLGDMTLYVTKEPCVMCAGAIVNSRLGRLVYGCGDEKAGAVAHLYSILTDERLNHRVEVSGGVLEEECADILRRFFKDRRGG